MVSNGMNTKLHTQEKIGTNREVRASFRKVVAFDLLFYGLGILTGAGITATILLS